MTRDLRAETQKYSQHLQHADEMLRLYVEEGLSFDEVGRRFGISREYARLHLPEDAYEQKRAYRKALERELEFNRACRRALAQNRKCKACGSWILRSHEATCSPECAEAWAELRYVDDPDLHRRAMANVYLASPEKYSEVQLEWARRMLGPNPPKRNRKYLVPGSKRAELIRKYRPAVYEELAAS